MTKPINYLLVGLPYSGKSTLAIELKNRYDFAQINIDELKFKKGYKDKGDDEVPDKVWDEIFIEADELIIKYLKEGKNIANEYAWVTRAWRDRARKVAKDAGFDTKVIYIKIPLSVIKERWLKNNQSKSRFQWPEHEFENYINDFEVPTTYENVIVYDQSIPANDWIKNNILPVLQSK